MIAIRRKLLYSRRFTAIQATALCLFAVVIALAVTNRATPDSAAAPGGCASATALCVETITPNIGPTAGGTGFGAAYNANGTITVTGNGFIYSKYDISPSYVTGNAQSGWTNPTFTSANSSDAFGGTISLTGGSGSIYSNRNPYHIFDKATGCSSGNTWQSGNYPGSAGQITNNNPFLITYTLPQGKYVNLQQIQIWNGYYAPVQAIEFFAGGDTGIPLTGWTPIPGTYTGGDGTMCAQLTIPQANIADVWTNQITIRVYPPTARTNLAAAQTFLALNEVIYSGSKLDLTSLNLGSNYPTYFTMSDLTMPASAVKVGGNDCIGFTVVSNTQITCVPPASTLPGYGDGTVDVTVVADGLPSTYAVSSADDDYTYYAPMFITSVSPNKGPNGGGTQITVTGYNFGVSQPSASPVVLDMAGVQAPCNVSSWSNTQIICTTSPHAPATVSVTVDNGRETVTTPATASGQNFTYFEVSLSLVTNSGSSSDGNPLVGFNVTPNVGVSSNYLTATAKTNNPSGYTLSIEANGSGLVCTDDSAYEFSTVTTTGDIGDNEWGWNYAAPPASGAPPAPSTWRPIPYGSAFSIAATSTASGPLANGVSGDDYLVWFGAKANFALPSCVYRQTFVMTATAKL